MPFRDIATVDSVYLQDVPAADDHTARTTLRRMQEVRHLAFAFKLFKLLKPQDCA